MDIRISEYYEIPKTYFLSSLPSDLVDKCIKALGELSTGVWRPHAVLLNFMLYSMEMVVYNGGMLLYSLKMRPL